MSIKYHTTGIFNPELEKAFQIAYELQKAHKERDQAKIKELMTNKVLLLKLLEFLILNIDSVAIDRALIQLILTIFNLGKEKEEEKEEEQEIDKEALERINKFIIYEIYKMMNPNRLAGETSLENFIKNVKLRGISEALKYEGKEYAVKFSKSEIADLQAFKSTFLDIISQAGFRSAGIEK